MVNKNFKALLAGLLAVLMLLSASFGAVAEDGAQELSDAEVQESASETAQEPSEEETSDRSITVLQPTPYEAYMLRNAIANLTIQIADTYYYGVLDEDLLYAALCSAIDKGYFDFNSAVREMIKLLGDGFSEYYTPERFESFFESIQGEFYGIGVEIMLSKDHVVVTGIFPDSPAERAGIKLYDKIVSIDDHSVSGLSLADVAALIKREKGNHVKVGIVRGGSELYIDCICDEVDQNPVSYEIIEDGKIGYIYLSTFSMNLDEYMKPVLSEFDEKGIKNVILDIRDNGGGELNAAIALANYFIPEGTVTKLKYKHEEQNEDLTVTNGMKEPKYNLVLLVNENSASASELFAGAVKARKAGTIIGTNTYGKGSMQTVFRLSTGAGVRYTIAEFYSPNDERIHTIGIEPDYVINNNRYYVDESKYESIDLDKPDDTTPGPHIKAIEQRLDVLGIFKGEPDEVFDEKTEDAIKLFQAMMRMEITGQPDFYTILAIVNYDYNFITEDDDQLEAAVKYALTGKIE